MTATELLALPARTGFIEPMQLDQVLKLPEGSKWAYEAKLDGYHCLAGKTDTGSNALVPPWYAV
jgi:hypothetical protein